VLVAEVLEGMTVDRGRHAIKDLLDLLPHTALLRRGGEPVEIRVADLRPDDTVVTRPGDRIAVDGLVLSGHSFVDQSPITGESTHAEKVPGAPVYAGTINQSGALAVRVTHVGRDTTFGKIIDAVEHAEQTRAPVQKIADRLAGYLVYFAVGAAVRNTRHRPRPAFSHLGGDRRRCLRHRGRHASGHPRRDRPRRTAGAIVKGGRYIETLPP
jgi:Cd2+/Zn2+-exporting ATPase/Cu+-exporting ATPase